MSLPKTVGVQISKTSRSATLRFIKKMFVEFRMSFVFKITIGTCEREEIIQIKVETFSCRTANCVRQYDLCILSLITFLSFSFFSESKNSVPL